MTISDVDLDRSGALEALHRQHHGSLVRSAAWILDDQELAEELVQESYIRLAGVWDRLDDRDAALSYLRKTVFNLSHSKIRRLIVGRSKHRAVQARPVSPDVEQTPLMDSELAEAIRQLSVRQRECIVLRYEHDLSIAQIAEVLGIAEGSAKSHIHRALGRLSALVTPGAYFEGNQT